MIARKVVAGVAAAACGIVGGIAAATPAAAYPPPAVHNFTPSDPNWVRENNIARFTGQVEYRSMTFAWALRLNPSVQAIVLNPMTCDTRIYGLPGYSDYHPDIGSDYMLHSSAVIQRGVTYQLRSRCDFNVLTNTGPTPSNVETSIDFTA